jgi:spore coat polysaccharide biosynthesis protein SpsF (cytidylyltransferase family)
MAEIAGEPALALLIKRVRSSRSVQRIAVATSTDAIDDPIAEQAQELGISTVRGPRDDVLARFLLAVGDQRGPVIRLTGDCPLIDPALIDETVALYQRTPGIVYASNVEPRTFPDGLDVEVVAADVLRAVAEDPLSPADREHVTSAIRAAPGRFPAASLVHDEDLGHLRWTVDEQHDLEFVRAVVVRLGERRYQAGLDEIVAAIRLPPPLIDFGGVPRG